MRKFYYVIGLICIGQLAYTQCPTGTVQSSNDKCYSLSWATTAEVPSPAPDIEVTNQDDGSILTCSGSNATLSGDGLTYEYFCDGFSGNCSNGSTDPLNGSMSLDGGDPCVFADGVLPLEFIGLTSKIVDNRAEITFLTASEVNVDRFFIEKSHNQTNWVSIGEMPATNTGNGVQEYKFIDPVPYIGQNYYRIREVDLDGSEMYSRVVFAKSLRGLDQYDVFPNPSNGKIYLESIGVYPAKSIAIVDTKGTEIYRKTLSSHEQTVAEFNLDLLPGFYYLLINDDFGQTTKKLIIE